MPAIAPKAEAFQAYNQAYNQAMGEASQDTIRVSD